MWLAYQSTGVIYGDIGMFSLPLPRNYNNLLFLSQVQVPYMSTLPLLQVTRRTMILWVPYP